MSFDHKAYIFDWNRFEKECTPILREAYTNENPSIIEKFIQSNVRSIKNPYDGEHISSEWKSQLEKGDMQELSDFAITKYYNLESDFGLSGNWLSVEEELQPVEASALLGNPFSAYGVSFDPGLQGSYFQSPNTMQNSINALASNSNPMLVEFCKGLRSALSKGVYVTF